MEIDIDLQLIRQHSVDLLNDIKAIFDKWGIVFWLDQGTLLGAFREKDFLALDDDIDLGVWKTDLDRNNQIWNDFRKAGFVVFFLKQIQTVRIERKKRVIGWRSVDIQCYDRIGNKAVKYFQKPKRLGLRKCLDNIIRAIDTICETKSGPDLRYKNIKMYIGDITQSSILINVPTPCSEVSALRKSVIQIVSYISPSRILCYFKHIVSQLKLYLCSEVIYLETPIHFFRGLKEIEFLGIRLRTPALARKYLRFKYGDDWETPRGGWIYYEHDGAIKATVQKQKDAEKGSFMLRQAHHKQKLVNDCEPSSIHHERGEG